MSEQATLLDLPEQGIVVVPDDPAGVSTGDRLRRQHPETYAQIVRGLAEGMSVSALSRATGVHRATIRAVRYGAETDGSVVQAKARTRHQLARLVEACVERQLEDVDDMSPRDRTILMGVSFDKLQLADGAPTSIVERRDAPTHDDLNAFLDSMRRAQPVSEGGNSGQKDVAPVRIERAAGDLADAGSVESASVVSDGTS